LYEIPVVSIVFQVISFKKMGPGSFFQKNEPGPIFSWKNEPGPIFSTPFM